MIPHGVEIFVGLEPIDLRWSFDRLVGIVVERIDRDARGGALFVFFGKRREAIKILFHDGSGLCLFYKRLDRGTFVLPEPRETGGMTVEIDEGTMDDLLDGINIEKPARRVPVPRKSPLH
jgi:transposase